MPACLLPNELAQDIPEGGEGGDQNQPQPPSLTPSRLSVCLSHHSTRRGGMLHSAPPGPSNQPAMASSTVITESVIAYARSKRISEEAKKEQIGVQMLNPDFTTKDHSRQLAQSQHPSDPGGKRQPAHAVSPFFKGPDKHPRH